jgi:pilus assembly protein CpaB
MELRPGLKRRLPLLVSIGFGAVAVALMNAHVNAQIQRVRLKEQELLRDYKDPVKLVVAAKDLPPGTPLDAGHLTAASIPEKFVQPYAARTPRDVIGLVTIAPTAQGEQILTNKLRRADEATGDATLAGTTPKGTRAVTIGVDAITGVGGFVRPGDDVDVLWTLKLPGGAPQESQVVMLTLFQKVPVLAVGGQMIGRPAAGEGQQAPRDYTVTLALTPQETSFLLFAREQGRIQLSLRPKREEDAQAAVPPTNINTLLEAKLGIKPAAPPKPARQVEVYKGLKRDVVLLPEDGTPAAQ